MIEAVAFDFDGVLVGIDTHRQTRIQALQEFANETGDERFIASDELHTEAHRHGTHPLAIIGWVLQQQGLVPSHIDPQLDELTHRVVERKHELYLDKVQHGLDALDGAIDAVEWASQAVGKAHVAIATTASREEVVPFIARYNLQGNIGQLVAKQDVGKKLKPHPEAYLQAAKKMNVDPRRSLAIEDSPRGLQAARLAGFMTVGITTTHTSEQLDGHAHLVINSFSQLPGLVI